MATYDGIIIGAGPNGLTLGAYMAKAGLKVLLLDQRFEMGGGLTTEELTLPGFRHNTHAVYHMMVDYAPPYSDLELEKSYNLKYVSPSPVMAMLLSDGRSLCLYPDEDRTCRSLGKFSEKDADTYRNIHRKYKVYMEEFLAPATYYGAMAPLEQVAKLETTEVGRELNKLTEQSPQQIVDGLFENPHVRALMLYVACMWGLEYDVEGVGFLVPLMINRATSYRLCVGGSHQLAQALAKFIYDHGGLVLGSQHITRIVVDGGTARGVELDDGTVYEANKFVASSIDPHQTFLQLVGRQNLSQDFVQRVEDWKWDKWSLFGVHMALDTPPQFAAASSEPDVNHAFVYIVGYDTPDELIKHWKAIARGELVKAGFNCCFPSVHDPSQAPPGRCTGLISEFAPYTLKEGGAEEWYRVREQHAQQCIATLGKYATNMTEDNILWTYISSPLDVENTLPDMVQGSIKQGAYLPFQMGYLRPNEECPQHTTPIKNLYVCGASSHSGGMVILGPGYVAANAIAEDLGIDKWWPEPQLVTRAREKGLL